MTAAHAIAATLSARLAKIPPGTPSVPDYITGHACFTRFVTFFPEAGRIEAPPRSSTSAMFRKSSSARIRSATSPSDVTFQSTRSTTPELGFEPRSEAPQASRMSKLPHSGAPVASRRRYNSYRSRDGTDSFSTSIARRKISSIRPLAYTSRNSPRSR